MAIKINMPRLGLTMTEGIIAKWLKQPGDQVQKGEDIAEIESDKSVVPFQSPEDGVILKLLYEEGDACKIYEPFVVIGEAGESVEEFGTESVPAQNKLEERPQTEQSFVKEESAPAQTLEGGRIFISPAAKKLALENNIAVVDIPFPTGKKRIEKADVQAYLASGKVKATPLAAKMAAEQGVDLSTLGKQPGERVYAADLQRGPRITERKDNVFSVSGMRKVIATKMKASIETAAHITLTTEVDMSNVVAMRSRILDKVSEKYGVKVSYNDIIVKCVALALCENPRINSYYTDQEIIEKGEINIGVAVALDEGLMVPVLRNADEMSIGAIALESKNLAEKAKQGKLMPDEYSGGTFTVSNLGMYEITQFTSIINQPESAILSVGKIVDRPVVVNGQIEARPIMQLTINFDHRPIDGSKAAIFLRRVKQLLEEPYELLV